MKCPTLLTALLSAGLGAVLDAKPADVLVVVRQEISIPSAAEQNARTRVTWLYDRAGVRILWRDTPRPATDGAVVIHVKYSNTVPEGISADALAFASPFGNAETEITVLYDRIRHVARRPSREGPLLAHVLAHELGHILQRTNAHTATGIMKAKWTGDDYDAMDRSRLTFTPTDLELIREGLATLKLQARASQ